LTILHVDIKTGKTGRGNSDKLQIAHWLSSRIQLCWHVQIVKRFRIGLSDYSENQS